MRLGKIVVIGPFGPLGNRLPKRSEAWRDASRLLDRGVGCPEAYDGEGGELTQPFSVPAEGGRATWTDGLNLFKALAGDTGGALALWESLLPQGSSPPLHVHFREDEAFYVLNGELTFRLGDQLVPAAAGTFLWGPRDVPHQYRVDSPTARLLTLFVPGGGEELFFHMSRPAEAITLPPPSDQPAMPPPELIAMLEQRYGGKVLGPPMGPAE